MNITETNKLIAEFMGLEISKRNPNKCENPKYMDGSISPMQFERSWDWLMPVINAVRDKNDSIGHHIFNDELVDYSHAIEDAVWENNIEQAYVNVIFLINWYNSKK